MERPNLKIGDMGSSDSTGNSDVVDVGQRPGIRRPTAVRSLRFHERASFFRPDEIASRSFVVFRDSEGTANRAVWCSDDGKSWLTLSAAASGLVPRIQRTGQFAIHVVCKSAEGEGSTGQIVSISAISMRTNLTMRQEDSSLVFWFRSPLSARHAQLDWNVPNIFAPNQVRRHSCTPTMARDLYLYMDGKRWRRPYRLGPGAALAHMIGTGLRQANSMATATSITR